MHLQETREHGGLRTVACYSIVVTIACVPECAWHAITWGDAASLDDAAAERYSLDRAGGPWCKHHFGRHRWARVHQLTGRLAVLAMTLDADKGDVASA